MSKLTPQNALPPLAGACTAHTSMNHPARAAACRMHSGCQPQPAGQPIIHHCRKGLGPAHLAGNRMQACQPPKGHGTTPPTCCPPEKLQPQTWPPLKTHRCQVSHHPDEQRPISRHHEPAGLLPQSCHPQPRQSRPLGTARLPGDPEALPQTCPRPVPGGSMLPGLPSDMQPVVDQLSSSTSQGKPDDVIQDAILDLSAMHESSPTLCLG